MKIRNLFALLIPLVSSYGSENHGIEPHYVWVEGQGVIVHKEEAYVETHKGAMRLNVVEYDPVNNRYLVRCNCSKNKGQDPVQALGLFFDED